MYKIKLILTPEYQTIFRAHYLESIWEPYFQIEEDIGQLADARTIYVGPFYESKWAKNKKQNGAKVALDITWEYQSFNNYYCINSKNWFWYNESLWYTSLGYNSYVPDLDFKYTAFMPINSIRPWRSKFINDLGPRLNNFLWSYNTEKTLPGDLDREDSHWQRHFNPQWYPQWYNSTEFSLVVESNLELDGFVTEKTFKALAFNHPLLVCGPTNVLSMLQHNGFETFSDIFDESYDTCLDSNERINKVISNLDLYNSRTNLTQGKLDHNRNRFYDLDLVKSKIIKEIIEPLIEYAET